MRQIFKKLAIALLGASALGFGAASAHDRYNDRYDDRYDDAYYDDYDYGRPDYCRYDHDHRVHDHYYYNYYPADRYYRSGAYINVRISNHHRRRGHGHRH